MEKLNQWMGVISNFGVIAGLVLLAYELQQNSDLMRAQTRHELTDSAMELNLAIATNTDLAVALRRSSNERTEPEAAMVRGWVMAAFNNWQDVHYQYRMGLYDATEFQPQRIAWEQLLRYPGIVDEFCLRRQTYSASLIAEVDRIVDRLASPCPEEISGPIW